MTRARFASGCPLFEIDQPGVLEFKDATLGARGAAPRCRRTAIGVDLREDWLAALRPAGFDPLLPTAWVAEGLLAYLPPEAQLGMLGLVNELAAPGSTLAFDRIAGDPTAGDRLQSLSERSGIDMRSLQPGGQSRDLCGFLETRSWESRRSRQRRSAGATDATSATRSLRPTDAFPTLEAERPLVWTGPQMVWSVIHSTR